jgi:hypothetical protein
MVAILFSEGPERVRVSITSWRPGKQKRSVSRQRAGKSWCDQPPPEKCAAKLCANEPKPPRVTPPEPESELPDDAWLEVESPEKKLLREEEPPPPEPPDDDPRGGHSAFICGIAGPAIPGEGGRQFSFGISA